MLISVMYRHGPEESLDITQMNTCGNCGSRVFVSPLAPPWCPVCAETGDIRRRPSDTVLPRVSRPRSIGNSLVNLFSAIGRNTRRQRSQSQSRSAFMTPGQERVSGDLMSMYSFGLAHSMGDLLPSIQSPPKSAEKSSSNCFADGARKVHTKLGNPRVGFKKKAKREEMNIHAPIKLFKTPEDLKKAIEYSHSTGDWSEIFVYYTTTFSSFKDINRAFEIKDRSTDAFKTKCGLELVLVRKCFESLMNLPSDIQKSVLKAAINCLLTDQRNSDVILVRPVALIDLRAYTVMLQNPQFRKPSTFVVYAHLLRQVATLCDDDQKMLADWFSELGEAQFTKVMGIVQQFINVRLFPPRPEDLPPMSKCSWWIPCAVKVLAIFNHANDTMVRDMGQAIVPFTDFYNNSLDHWDLMTDFNQWQSPITSVGFSFCHYPFILSITAKKQLLEGHAEQQMIANARDSIIGSLVNRRAPDINMLFCNISIRRQHLLEDSLREISEKQDSLRKKLRVSFRDEPGLDMGGLAKEWFQLVTRKIFHPDYGMFKYHRGAEVYWFSTAQPDVLQEYHLVGVLMGLAVYNGVILDVRFPLCCFKKLLGPPVVPRVYDITSTPLGIVEASLKDLEQIDPDVARGLKQLLEYNGNVEDDFGLTFQITVEEFGQTKTVELKEDGCDIPVINDNKEEYVALYVDWYINRALERQFKAFYLGFHSVCSSNLLLLLRPEEIELLVCGSPHFDLSELRNVTVYDGFKPSDPTVRHFWDLVLKLPEKHQKRLLGFVTGTDRIPAGGMKEMTFKITKMPKPIPDLGLPIQTVPMAHTCFNQLVLPDYQDRHLLRQKLVIALSNGEGFGLE
uniref:HECT-type E3 ubiquitin transferase n=1 Tax=Plectus sambesii TaxID=2011161 RepID=A0A914V3A1_9BILA